MSEPAPLPTNNAAKANRADAARRIDFTSDVGARSFRIPITVRTE